MKKSIIIETLQWTLEATMQEWLNTKKELFELYTQEITLSAELRIELEEAQEALNTYKNMSVWEFIKSKYENYRTTTTL